MITGYRAMSLQSLGDRLDASAGRPSGFDYMKVSLAVMVIATHSVLTSYGQAADAAMWDTPARPFLRSVLPMFFGVSGFLVAASLDRCKTLIKFFGLRAIRIFPALTVEVLLSAFDRPDADHTGIERLFHRQAILPLPAQRDW